MGFRMAKLNIVRNVLQEAFRLFYVKLFGMDLSPTCKFSLSAKFDKTNPRGVHVGSYSYVAFDVAILTHDLTRGVRLHTVIEENCFIGARSILLPGVKIGSGSIVGAGSVVTKDVPPRSIVAGNPAVVIRSSIDVGRYGRLPDADSVQRRTAAENNLD